MTRSRLVVIISLVVVILLGAFVAIRIADATYFDTQREIAEVEESYAPTNEYRLERGKTTEVLVDMGVVQRSTTAQYDVVLTNATDTTLLLLDFESTCRCVWLEFPRRAIAPAESVTANLSFDSRGEWGSIGNYISVSTSLEDVGIAVWMCAEVE